MRTGRNVSGPESLILHELSRRALLRRMTATAGILALPSGLLAACGGDSESPSGGSGGAVGKPLDIDLMKIGISANQRSLDVANNFYSSAWGPKMHSVEAPLRFKPDGTVEPNLAEAYERPDDTTYVLTIRQGVTFHDGSDMTTDDVVFAMQRNIDQKTTAGTQFYGSVASIQKTGDWEVTISLSKIDPLFELVLAYPATWVESKAYFEKAGDQFGTPAFPGMGTGPLKVDTFDLSNGYVLTNHDGYWGDPLKIGRVEATPITDPGARLLALQSKSINLAENVPVDSIDTWAQAGTVYTIRDFFWFGWSFPMDEPPFDDIHVRRAIAYATNSEDILGVASPDARAALGVTPPSFWTTIASQDDIDKLYAELPQYDFDMDKAKEEMSQSSVPDGFDVTVWVSNQYPQMEAMASNTGQNLKELGIELSIEERPTEQILPRWLGLDEFADHKGLGLMPMIHGATLPEGGAYTTQALSTKAIAGGGFNSARYSNPDVDALFDQAANTVDPAERWDAYSQILKTCQEDLPFHSVFFDGPAGAMDKAWSIPEENSTPWQGLRQWWRDIRSV